MRYRTQTTFHVTQPIEERQGQSIGWQLTRTRRSVLAIVLSLMFGHLVVLDAADQERPNVIYILADDLGYGDLGCYGNRVHRTPHIDSLAEGGVRFTDFHAAPWCAPSRRALMTGCHASRPWDLNGQRWGRLAAAITIPEMLRASGYFTALLGKWHLEMGPGLHPLDQGFAYWYGTRGSNDWDGPRPNYSAFRDAPEADWKTPLHVNRENRGPVVPQSLFTRRYTEEAVRLIREHREGAFFIYLAHNMPHVPIFASPEFRGKSENGVYGDVVEELDWSVGEIVKALHDNELYENTLVVFTSDNGPWTMFNEFGGVADPLRGEKSTTWEGGERVPCIMSWPGMVPPGECRGLVANYDVYATLAQLTGTQIAEGQAIDSLDLSGVLLYGEASPRTHHISYFRQAMAYRRGRYKLHAWTRDRTRNPITGAAEASQSHDPPLLFDLDRDGGEQVNVAGKHPKLLEQMREQFSEAQQAIKNWDRY